MGCIVDNFIGMRYKYKVFVQYAPAGESLCALLPRGSDLRREDAG